MKVEKNNICWPMGWIKGNLTRWMDSYRDTSKWIHFGWKYF